MEVTNKKDIIFWLAFALGSVLFGYVLIRAFALGFTHDESITYTIVDSNSNWRNTPNNHLLNTWIMRACSLLFGDGELSMRLPNVLSFPFYLLFSFLISKKTGNKFLTIGGFILLSFNPFILEFFSLARGYGLSLALMLASIYYLLKYINSEEKNSRTLLFTFILCILSVLANLILLNFYLSILMIIPLMELYTNSRSTGKFQIVAPLKKFISNNKIFVVMNVLSFGFVLFRLFMMKNSGELYYGDKQNIWESTFKSIINCSLYGVEHGKIIYGIICSFFPLTILLSFVFLVVHIKNKTIGVYSVFLFATILSILIPVAQNILLDIPYPTQRTAIIYLPLIVISSIFCLNEIITLFKKTTKILIPLVILISFFSIYHSARAANLTKTYCFSDDSSTKEMMHDLYCDFNKDHQYQPVSIGCNWLFEPSMNYYKLSKKFDWLDPVSRDGMSNKMYEYYYCYVWQKESIPEHKKLLLINSYPESQTVLLRRNYRKLLLSKVVNFDSLIGKAPYSEIVMPFDSIPANSEIVLKVRPKSMITKDMKAFVLFYGAEDWQGKMIFHEEIYGDREILLDKGSSKPLHNPILVYRNWQATPTIPALEIEVMIYSRPPD